tara:strand:- start:43 stop:162 length:120 start_codon:yes stop_codon:yes gene_type:complete
MQTKVMTALSLAHTGFSWSDAADKVGMSEKTTKEVAALS